jgi:hypothetical protein
MSDELHHADTGGGTTGEPDMLQRIPDIPQGIDAFTVVGPAIHAWARNVGAAVVTRAPA